MSAAAFPRKSRALQSSNASPTNLRYNASSAAVGAGAARNSTKTAAAAMSGPELTSDQAKEIEDAFRTFDMDQDQHLHVHELKVAMRALGFDMKLADANDLIAKYGTDDRRLPLHEFRRIMNEKMRERDPLDEVRRAFMLFDEDGSGRISKDDLIKVARELNELIDEGELAAMIAEFDLDGDGEIDFDEFTAIMMDEH